MRIVYTIAAAICLIAATTVKSDAALNFYLRIVGQSQGEIKGDVIQRGREGLIQGIEYRHEIVSPRDAASGLATGKRQHKPITFVMEIDRSYPNLIQALVTNERLNSVELRFWKPNRLGTAGGGGAETQYMTITLTNATISRIATRLPNTKDPNQVRFAEYAELDLTYERIRVTHHETKGFVEDTWGLSKAQAPGLGERAIVQRPAASVSRRNRSVSRR